MFFETVRNYKCVVQITIYVLKCLKIIGSAIGDGIGLATEFMRREQAQLLYGNGPIKFGMADG